MDFCVVVLLQLPLSSISGSQTPFCLEQSDHHHHHHHLFQLSTASHTNDHGRSTALRSIDSRSRTQHQEDAPDSVGLCGTLLPGCILIVWATGPFCVAPVCFRLSCAPPVGSLCLCPSCGPFVSCAPPVGPLFCAPLVGPLFYTLILYALHSLFRH